jgi:lysosomal alpha-glucosidase
LETELEEWVDLAAPLDKINLHIRGGAILPTQKPETTTTASRLNPFKLLITLDEDHEASGELFWDDGEQFDALEQATYTHVLFRLNKRGLLQSTVEKANYTNLPNLEELDILGSGKPHNVLVNGIDWPFLYDKEARVLKLLSLKLNLLLPFRISFVY